MTSLEKLDLLASGKAKKIYATTDDSIVWIESLDQATAFNGKSKEHIDDKGFYTTQISAQLFAALNQAGIATHYIEQVDERSLLAKKLTMIPVEVVIRNIAAGHFVSRYQATKGEKLTPHVIEFYLKNDALDDPMLNDSHLVALHLATKEQVTQIKQLAEAINELLSQLFDQLNILLVDFKLEFGITPNGQVILGDELSPDNMRLWDKTSGNSLDKDVFRQHSGDLITVYQDVLNRLQEKTGA